MDYNNELNFGTMTRDRELSMSQAFPILMRKVYVWMSLALAITGITAFGVANSPGVISAIYSNQIIFWGLMIAELALVFAISGAINRLSLTTATLLFVLYSVINGVVLSSIFLVYTMTSIASVFICGDGICRLYHQDGSNLDGENPDDGYHWTHHRFVSQFVSCEEFWLRFDY